MKKFNDFSDSFLPDKNQFLNQNYDDQTFYDKIIDTCGFNKSILKIYAIAILFLIADGGEMMVISLITTKVGEQWGLSEAEKGSLGSSIFIGFFLGALVSGKVSDNHGRKPIIVISSVVVTIFAYFSSFSIGFFTFLFYRTLCGFGIGLSIPALITLISEISPTKYRSIMINCLWLFFPIGEVFVIIMAKFYIDSQEGWRDILIFASIPCLIAIILSMYIFESPKFLICNGRIEEGFEIIKKMIYDTNKKFKLDENEKKAIAFELKEAETNKINSDFKELITEKYLRLTYLVCAIFFIVSFIYYGLLYVLPQVMHNAVNESNNNAKEIPLNFEDIYVGLIMSALSEIPGNIVAAIFANMQILGRKYSMALGFAVSAVFLFLSLLDISNLNFYSSVIKFAISLPFNIIYLYTVEAYPTKIRSIALGASNSFSRLGGIVTPFFSQIFFSWNYKLPFFVYFVNSVLGVLCCLYLPFETRIRKIH